MLLKAVGYNLEGATRATRFLNELIMVWISKKPYMFIIKKPFLIVQTKSNR